MLAGIREAAAKRERERVDVEAELKKGNTQKVFPYLKRRWGELKGRKNQLLYWASRGGSSEIVEFLLRECEADVNSSMDACALETPLHAAVWKRHSGVVELLLSFGADSKLRTKYGDSSEDYALVRNFPRGVELLGLSPPPLSYATKEDCRVLEVIKEERFGARTYRRAVGAEDIKRTVRVVVISDTHNRHSRLRMPDGDVCIHCGDFSDHGSPEEVKAFSEWFCGLPYAHKVLVPGNHEKQFRQLGAETVRTWFPGVHYLVDEVIDLEGLRICGTPWMNMGSFDKDNHTRRKLLEEAIPADADIHVLVTHVPPWRVRDEAGDMCGVFGDTSGRCRYCPHVHRNRSHWGVLELLNRVMQTQPLLHVFGHVHEEFGFAEVGGCRTVFLNAAMDLCMRPYVVEVNF